MPDDNREKLFRRHFANVCLDIRRLKTARVYDQKVTPDVVTAVADVALAVAPDQPFSIQRIWDSDEFRDAATALFGKPAPSDALAGAEYDKFIGQPLLALHHAAVLEGRKARAWEYRIVNAPVLREIAASETAALDFLSGLAFKILTDSGLGAQAGRFLTAQDQAALDDLERAFLQLLVDHTGIRNRREIGRIFPKLLNVLAFQRRRRGRIAGRLSRGRITLHDIRYNRVNWRDAKKPKEVTRRGFRLGRPERPESAPARVASAMRDVKTFHGRSPEIMDARSGGGMVEAHHIFPRGAYPELAMVRENIILLAPTQHAAAHAGREAKAYQLLCLQRKLDAVQQCESAGGNFYSMSDFIGMLSFCGVLSAQAAKTLRHQFEAPADGQEERETIIRQTADELRRLLTSHYLGG